MLPDGCARLDTGFPSQAVRQAVAAPLLPSTSSSTRRSRARSSAARASASTSTRSACGSPTPPTTTSASAPTARHAVRRRQRVRRAGVQLGQHHPAPGPLIDRNSRVRARRYA